MIRGDSGNCTLGHVSSTQFREKISWPSLILIEFGKFLEFGDMNTKKYIFVSTNFRSQSL